MAVTAVAALLPIVFLFVFLHSRSRKARSLRDVRGPSPRSFWLGNRYEMMTQNEVGDCESLWIREYGAAFRVSLPWGHDSLLLADPKALQHVLQTSGYTYQKPSEEIYRVELLLGNGLITAEAPEVHKRQRKVLTPGFAMPQLKLFFPLFQNSASRLTEKWTTEILASGGKDINICNGLGKITLDALGDTAFDYRFDALHNADNVITKSLNNLFVDSVMYPAKWDLLVKGLYDYLPSSLVRFYVAHVPQKEYVRFKTFRDIAEREAAGLVNGVGDTDDGHDTIMSILVKSNLAEDPKRRMSEKEIVGQMATLILAGQETAALTLAWLLYEFTRHPEDQTKLRQEIMCICERKGTLTSRDLTQADYEGMPFLSACIKESLRFHAVTSILHRYSTRDDVIPLSTPVVGKSGQLLHEIPVSKGQTVSIYIAGYNRLSSVWGADADKWNPSRFLGDQLNQQTTLGVFANLLSFSAGVRACLGWRFALLEMQCILVELIENFEFSPPNVKVDVRRAFAGFMVPLINDHEGIQMPLQVRPIEA